MTSASQILHFECLTASDALQQVADIWNEDVLAPHPFLEFDWLNHWWNSFGTNHSLYLLLGYQESTVRVMAPWYLHRSLARGKEIRFLGSGRACSDYMTLLEHPDNNPSLTRMAIEGLAEFVATDPSWDMIHLDGVTKSDTAINCLEDCLRRRDVDTRYEPATSTWRLELPTTWEDYLTQCNKKIRQKFRRVLRDASQRETKFHFCDEPREFDRYFKTFVNLHVSRRGSVQGDRGCFETAEFEQFLRSASQSFQNKDCLWMGQLDVDDQPAASCLGFESNETLYFYQSGSNPLFNKMQPGWLLNANLIQRAIQRGLKAIDYLRGDEAYKARLSAIPTQQRRLLAVANHVTSKTRDRLLQTARMIKQSLVND